MAKDASSKSSSNSNSSNDTSSSSSSATSDHQKIPPLRIVLNTSSNQKSTSTTANATGNPNQNQTELKREKSNDGKTDSCFKSGARVRIKLGTGKSQPNKNNTSSSQTSRDSTTKTSSPADEASRPAKTFIIAGEKTNDNNKQEDITAVNYSHLRRITRRSQRTVQTVSNEDEESISSMTSSDENQTSSTNTNIDNANAQDGAVDGSTTSQGASNTIAPNSSSSTAAAVNTPATSATSNQPEHPRPRYKRRKVEAAFESHSNDQDGIFGLQNYRLPNQNSFELFKNIRKHVDKKLKNLTSIHPKTPHGFRDYMLLRGAYLLDGNKLGNGTNLFMSEDGDLKPYVPIGKYHALRNNRVNYSVPNRAKAPVGLPMNSPLHGLFVEQEKERYRLRMQHIKEREKLTLAAEQEFVRCYNQAAMMASNQAEPFSACTLLKHQEIYNYLDSDGATILANEDMQREQGKPESGVRTRRRHHEQISSPPARKNSNTEESQANQSGQTPKAEASKNTQSEQSTPTPKPTPELSVDAKQSDIGLKSKEMLIESTKQEDPSTEKSKNEGNDKDDSMKAPENVKKELDETVPSCKRDSNEMEVDEEKSNLDQESAEASEIPKSKGKDHEVSMDSKLDIIDQTSQPPDCKDMKSIKSDKTNEEKEVIEPESSKEIETSARTEPSASTETEPERSKVIGKTNALNSSQDQANKAESLDLVDEEKRLQEALHRDVFLTKLQEIDDKWEKIRGEMLIRHRNEAESLYAIQKLEWEWKIKEIGICDVRTTPMIDKALVPKLDVFSQDY